MDDSSSGRTSVADTVSPTNVSMGNGASSPQSVNINDGTIRVFNYKTNDFKHFSSSMVCEDIRTAMCRLLGIAPPAQLLFGIREHSTSRSPSALERRDHTWVMPGERLHCQLAYCFRMRFRVPELDSQLEVIDLGSHDFLYAQMRYDMRNELISDIRYPDNKNQLMGLAVMDMLIDKQEKSPAEQQGRSIERNYKMYLPPSVWREHRYFVGHKINNVLLKLGGKWQSVEHLKWHYVHRVSHLAPNYMTEQFTVIVQCLPNEDPPIFGSGFDVCVRVFSLDSAEPGLKVARVTSKGTLKWILLGQVEDIFTISKIDSTNVLLVFANLPKGYQMKFHNEKEMKSFISYLGIYSRLSSKWMQDLCHSYRTPSLAELDSLHCHGPIGGAYSLMKLHKEEDTKCGSYIIRECDREYDVYYIDIITKIIAKDTPQQRYNTETFCIVRKDSEWKLNINKNEHTLSTLQEVARFIQADVTDRIRISASVDDKPPLLLLLLPRNLKPKRTDVQLSEAELQRRNPQTFNPKTDLQWYPGSISLSEDGMMLTMRGDWIQKSPVKDVSVALKMMKKEGNFMELFRLTQAWSLIQSPQFLKLYGLTVSDPYTMVMEYSRYGPLNRFLTTTHVGNKSLVELMKGLVRGMHYLEDNKIIHSYIRCSNLYVTRYEPVSQMLDAKIGDPGYPRDYRESDLPWIPTKYYKNLQEAKNDINTQLWAFATTIYEIFSRSRKDLRKLTQEDLQLQILKDGHILPLLNTDLCPPQISETIMDGWSDDPKISHQDIFSRLIEIKTDDYIPPPLDLIAPSDGIADAVDGGNILALDAFHIFPSADMFMVVELKDCRLLFCESDKIGEGNFGVVYRGHLEYYDKKPAREPVAVKKLKGTQVSARQFRREMQIMSSLDHPNIVKFKYWSESITSIVMEFLFGSFKKYLSFMAPKLNNTRLVCYALDIAQGMKYLSGIGLIHRDLSTRNILVDRAGGKDCLKISDFGLAQFANAEGIANCPDYQELPFKWYSPEALATHKCSSYSDVWSYGVTLVETFSVGADPNLEPMQTSPEDFLNRLQQGERFPRPDCPDFIHDLMLMCWHVTPESRPSFATIVEFISREVGVDAVPPVDQPHPHK